MTYSHSLRSGLPRLVSVSCVVICKRFIQAFHVLLSTKIKQKEAAGCVFESQCDAVWHCEITPAESCRIWCSIAVSRPVWCVIFKNFAGHPPRSPSFPAAFRQNLGGISAAFAIPKKNNFPCNLSLFVWFHVNLEHFDVHFFIAGRKALFFYILFFLKNHFCYIQKKYRENAAFLPDWGINVTMAVTVYFRLLPI